MQTQMQKKSKIKHCKSPRSGPGIELELPGQLQRGANSNANEIRNINSSLNPYTRKKKKKGATYNLNSNTAKYEKMKSKLSQQYPFKKFFFSAMLVALHFTRQCHRLSFHLERWSPQPSESGCRKCMALKKYLQDHRSSWKRLSALLCPSTWHWWFHFHFKFAAVAAGTTFVNCSL